MKKISKLLKILIVLAFLIVSSSMNFTNFNKVEAATNEYTADDAITKVQSLVKTTVRFW